MYPGLAEGALDGVLFASVREVADGAGVGGAWVRTLT